VTESAAADSRPAEQKNPQRKDNLWKLYGTSRTRKEGSLAVSGESAANDESAQTASRNARKRRKITIAMVSGNHPLP